MLIKPIVEQLKKAPQFFLEVRVSKDIPALDDLKNSKTVLPICYLLPVKDAGNKISANNRPKQSIVSTYSFCLITEAGDLHTLDEPPMTQAKEKLIEALLGFAISPSYHPMEFTLSQIKESNKKYESWVLEFQTARTFRK